MSIYGHAGKPCLVFPPQDGKHGDWKAFGMIDAMADYINDGRIQVFCCDSIDEETWSNQDGDPRQRIERQEAYFNYICEELVDWILDINEADCGLRAGKLMTTGASMGGYHAVNCMMRRPDLFDKVLSLSGLFQSDYFFHDYHDDLTYANSPLDFLPNMSRIIRISACIMRATSSCAADRAHGKRRWSTTCTAWKRSLNEGHPGMGRFLGL